MAWWNPMTWFDDGRRAAGFTITVAGSVLHHRPACPAKPRGQHVN